MKRIVVNRRIITLIGWFFETPNAASFKIIIFKLGKNFDQFVKLR